MFAFVERLMIAQSVEFEDEREWKEVPCSNHHYAFSSCSSLQIC